MGTEWVETYTSKKFFPLHPQPGDVDIRDIAHALSMICRFNGHTRFFYSVGQHSLGVQEELARDGYSDLAQLHGLLHDASEAYICDLAAPIKPSIPNYQALGEELQNVILGSFGLGCKDEKIQEAVKRYDLGLLRAEAVTLMGNVDNWSKDLPVCSREISFMNPADVEQLFLRRFNDLMRKVA